METARRPGSGTSEQAELGCRETLPPGVRARGGHRGAGSVVIVFPRDDRDPDGTSLRGTADARWGLRGRGGLAARCASMQVL